MERIPMTQEGYDRLAAELKRLKSTERPAVIKAIEEARAHGDLSENAEYHAAKEKQGHIETRIQELEGKTSRAQVIDPASLSGNKVMFGATVTLYDIDTEKEVTYQIVGDDEADIEQGKVSISSPIARALMGKAEEEEVEVRAPGGNRAYEIVSVEFK